jgi:hypothetical protein
MASQLNSYRNFIDIKTKGGQALVSNAIDKYVSPLMGDDRISLSGTSFQKLKDNLFRLSSRFGYDYLIKVINTVRTVDAAGDVTYSDPINMLERYSDDNVTLARKHASLTWGDRSFTVIKANHILLERSRFNLSECYLHFCYGFLFRGGTSFRKNVQADQEQWQDPQPPQPE